jgi:hypothetical protein
MSLTRSVTAAVCFSNDWALVRLGGSEGKLCASDEVELKVC